MIYLISRISVEAHKHNLFIAEYAAKIFNDDVFVPHLHNPFNIQHHDLEQEVFDIDLTAMKASKMAAVAFPVGSDCSGEIGWFAGCNKPCCALIIESPSIPIDVQLFNLRRSWMLKGFINEVLTDNGRAFEILRNDPIVGQKTKLL